MQSSGKKQYRPAVPAFRGPEDCGGVGNERRSTQVPRSGILDQALAGEADSPAVSVWGGYAIRSDASLASTWVNPPRGGLTIPLTRARAVQVYGSRDSGCSNGIETDLLDSPGDTLTRVPTPTLRGPQYVVRGKKHRVLRDCHSFLKKGRNRGCIMERRRGHAARE